MSIISLEDIKAHLAIDTAEDDALLIAKVATAEAWLAKFIGSPLDDVTAFPDGTPAPLEEAVRQLAGHLYENREASLVGVSADLLPLGVFDLVAPYRAWVF
ncbi:head-tail connector protein [Shinella zoogloeoides]|uniref:head-tail connector protein n=1 Tax=Shinella zoogloeoides TaxID=352475 RepID=UPI001F5828F3|nr:head-tail connector protein [Shinella zoogloeoides]